MSAPAPPASRANFSGSNSSRPSRVTGPSASAPGAGCSTAHAQACSRRPWSATRSGSRSLIVKSTIAQLPSSRRTTVSRRPRTRHWRTESGRCTSSGRDSIQRSPSSKTPPGISGASVSVRRPSTAARNWAPICAAIGGAELAVSGSRAPRRGRSSAGTLPRAWRTARDRGSSSGGSRRRVYGNVPGRRGARPGTWRSESDYWQFLSKFSSNRTVAWPSDISAFCTGISVVKSSAR